MIAIEAASGATHTTGGGAVLGAVIGVVVGNQVGSGTGRAAATGVGEFNYRTIGDLREGDRVRAEAGQLARR